jgi:CheY-like chemotaxis protein
VFDRAVMIVEDDTALRESLVEVLAAEGFTIVEAENGRQALQFLRDEGVAPEVILLDLMMPVMSGWEFRKEQLGDPSISSIPVIVMSATEPRGISASAMLPKPFGIDTLLAAISRTCSQGALAPPGPVPAATS